MEVQQLAPQCVSNVHLIEKFPQLNADIQTPISSKITTQNHPHILVEPKLDAHCKWKNSYDHINR